MCWRDNQQRLSLLMFRGDYVGNPSKMKKPLTFLAVFVGGCMVSGGAYEQPSPYPKPPHPKPMKKPASQYSTPEDIVNEYNQRKYETDYLLYLHGGRDSKFKTPVLTNPVNRKPDIEVLQAYIDEVLPEPPPESEDSATP